MAPHFQNPINFSVSAIETFASSPEPVAGKCFLTFFGLCGSKLNFRTWVSRRCPRDQMAGPPCSNFLIDLEILPRLRPLSTFSQNNSHIKYHNAFVRRRGHRR